MKRNIKKALCKALVSAMIATSFFSLAQVYANEAYTASSAAQEVYADSDKTYTTEAVDVNYKVYLNGTQIDLKANIRNVGGRTMLPLRAISKALGVDENTGIGWDGNYKTAMVQMNDNKVEVVRGSIKSIVNGQVSNTDLQEKMFIDSTGTSYLPLRSIGELLGCEVQWVASTQSILISTPTIPHNPEHTEDQRQNIIKYLKQNPDLTDEQLNDILSNIHIPPNGDGSGIATKEQLRYFEELKTEAYSGKYFQPDEPGDYVGQFKGTYTWDGVMWTEDVGTWAGMCGLTISPDYAK